jgi:hypothetical protein
MLLAWTRARISCKRWPVNYDDLTRASDDELFELEEQNGLDPKSWSDIDAEWRRRRQTRSGPADMVRSPGEQATVRDVERVAGTLEAALDGRLDVIEARTRRLRWWVFLSPPIWIGITTGVWIAIARFAPEILRGIGAAL